jgi:AAA+ superfamily predicted ATPase
MGRKKYGMEEIQNMLGERIKRIDYSEEESDYTEKKNSKGKKYSCWAVLENDEFLPSYHTINGVPPGVYEISYNSKISSETLKKQPFKTDELYSLPSDEIIDILKDIDNFWSMRDQYEKYKFVHKRGILMFGEPGCGKSGIIQMVSKNIIEKGGIVINIKDEDDVERFSSFIPSFREIEPDRPLIVILEDIDSIAGEHSYSVSRLLNILDGVKQIENVVYIATTNYPEKLQERITNRPSRFDRRYKVELPNENIRRCFIENKLTKEDLSKIDIEDWVKKTEGMSLSHLKEVVISVIIMGRGFQETLENLEGLKKSPTIKGSGKVGFGK